MSTPLMTDIEKDINPAQITPKNTPKFNLLCTTKFIKLIHQQDIQGVSLCEK